MNPLETWLGDEKRHDLGWRGELSGNAGSCPAALGKLAARMIWPRRFRHMRYLAPAITFHAGPQQSFTIRKSGKHFCECKPLKELVPPLAMPVGIVATGPSALDYPWADVRKGGKFLIAVNGAPSMLKELEITPDLLVITDREFALAGVRHCEAAKNVPLAIEFLAAAALASVAPHILLERPVAILERVNLWYGLPALGSRALARLNERSGMPFVLPETPDPKCRVGWSHRPELGIFSGRTVVFGALQVAVGCGATDIEIIGMDLSGSGRSYAEGDAGRPSQLQDHYESFILPSFRMMHRALAGTNVAVANRSRVCPLPKELFRELRNLQAGTE